MLDESDAQSLLPLNFFLRLRRTNLPDERKYKYLREDFGELPVHLEHLTIYLNFLNDRVEATNCLQMTARRGP